MGKKVLGFSLVTITLSLVPSLQALGTEKVIYGVDDRRDIVDVKDKALLKSCLLYTSPSPRDKRQSRMPSSA